MGKAGQFAFDHKEVVEALIKYQGIHEGIWMLQVRFGLTAANVNTDNSPNTQLPAAIVPIQEFGIVKTEVETSLTVDAAKVNPKKAPQSKKDNA